jgi:hypothetical protein
MAGGGWSEPDEFGQIHAGQTRCDAVGFDVRQLVDESDRTAMFSRDRRERYGAGKAFDRLDDIKQVDFTQRSRQTVSTTRAGDAVE